jgi:hypothetical protein
MQPDLKELVINPKGIGTLNSPNCEAEGSNPVCGDSLCMQLDLQDGRIKTFRWKAKACPATIAIASLAFLCYEGKKTPSGPPFESLRASIAKHGGLGSFETHALHLVEETLAQALTPKPRNLH